MVTIDKRIKVDNPTAYWEFESEWIFGEWGTEYRDINADLGHYYEYIIETFNLIACKYGILIPYVNFLSHKMGFTSFTQWINWSESQNRFGLSSYYDAFLDGKNGGCPRLLYPNFLFIPGGDKQHLQLITDIKDKKVIDSTKWEGDPYIYLNGSTGRYNNKILHLYIVLHCDGILSTIHNRSMYDWREDNPKIHEALMKYGVNNDDSYYLNTTRFNSFIRDICSLYSLIGVGMSFFSGDTAHPNDFESTINGVKKGNEVIYYEDIYDMLPLEERYQPFEEINYTLSMDEYHKFIENGKCYSINPLPMILKLIK